VAVRTDNDTWDITTSVGSTALLVAASRALEAQKPQPLTIDPYAEVFCRAAGGPWADLVSGNAADHQLRSADFGTCFVTFQGARTRFFDDYFRAAAKAGVRQIVVLAAGLDSRAYRLEWPAGTTVFELDQPQVLDFKREVLAAHGAVPRAERREVAVDLRDDWPHALRDSGFDPRLPSAWIAEGLLMYLPATAQGQLFADIDSLASAGSHAAIEDGVPMEDDAFRAAREEELNATDGRNPFFQLVYNEQVAPAGQWFSVCGWTASTTELSDYLRSKGVDLPEDGTLEAQMVDRISLVSAVKN